MDSEITQIDQLLTEGWNNRLNNLTYGRNLSEQALDMAQAQAYSLGIMRSYRNLAAIHIGQHSYEEGLTYINHALAMLDEQKYESDAIDIYLLAASVYVRLGNIPKALTYCYKAEDIAVAIDNHSRRAEVYKTIGNAYLTVQEYEKGIPYYHQAREMYQSQSDIEGEIIILNNLCHTYHHAGQFDQALHYGHLGLDLYEHNATLANPIQRVYAYNLNNVGSTYIKSGQFNEANPYFKKALKIFEQNADSYGEVYSWRGLGEISLHNQNNDEAISRFQRSLELAEKSGVATELILANRVLARAYKQMKQYEKALAYFEKFHECEKSIINDEIEKKIRNIEATHSVQQAQKESEIYQLKSVELQQEIDERKKAEQKLQTYATELERSNQELENFASIVSHDLKAPLRKIMVFGDRLQDRYADKLDDRGINYLDRMRSASERMQGLIHDLLTLSHVSTQTQTFDMISLNKVIQDVLVDLEVNIVETNASIHVNELPQIEADITQMRQLFQNLISNALKFHRPDALPKIEISSALLHQKGQKLCQLQIVDNGIGIDEKYHDRIFKLFERLPTHADIKGTGVGLAICHRIVERHGGTIEVESVLDKGTTFMVTLPLNQS